MKLSLLKSSSVLALLSLTGLGIALASSQAVAQNAIDTTGAWNHNNSVGTWGVGAFSTFGQTFTATNSDAILKDFTFYLDYNSGAATNYQAYVYQWDATNGHIAGSALYTSTVQTGPSTFGFEPQTFTIGSLDLTPGQSYVAFLSTTGVSNSGNSGYLWGLVYPAVPYTGGAWVSDYNGNDFNLLSTSPWSTTGNSSGFVADLAFSMNFAGDIDTAQSSYGSSGLGTTLNPHFTGGTLKVDQAGATYGQAFTLDGSTTNTILDNGNTVTFTGNFGADAAGVKPDLTLIDGVGGGAIKASGTWGTASAPMGTITNYTSLELLAGGSVTANSFINYGGETITVDSGAAINGNLTFNTGQVTNNGTWTGTAANGKTIVNNGVWNGDATNLLDGTITNAAGATWTGSLNNSWDVNNYGTWVGDANNAFPVAYLTNYGTWTGAVTNSGFFMNKAGAIVSGLVTQNAISGSVSETGQDGVTMSASASPMIVNDGTLNGGVVINGGSFYSGGTVNGGLTNKASVITYAGAINGAISNSGSGTFEVNGPLTSDSTFNNGASASLTIDNGATYTIGGAVTNAGTLAVASGGTLTATAGGLSNYSTGTIGVAAGGTVNGALQWNAGSVINNGAWTGALDNAAATTNGSVTNNGTWTGDVQNGANGSVTNATGATWTGTLANSHSVTNSGTWVGDAANVSTGTLVNYGTWTGGIVNNGLFLNKAGATVSGLTNLAGSGQYTYNAGTLNGGVEISGGELESAGTLNGGLTNFNSGAVRVDGGAVNGAILNETGASFEVVGTATSDSSFENKATSSLTVDTGASYTIAGALTNEVSGGLTGAVSVAKGGTLTATLTNNAIVTNNGTFNGNVSNASNSTLQNANVSNYGTWNGNVVANTNASTKVSATIVNYGAWNGNVQANKGGSILNAAGGVWTGNADNTAGSLFLNYGTWNGTLTNAASVTNEAGGTWNGNASNGASGTILNQGTWNGLVDGGLTNTGTFNVGSGTISGAVANRSGGVFSVGSGVNLTLASTSSFDNQSGANLNVSGTLTATGQLSGAGAITVNSGGTVNAAVTNVGPIDNYGTWTGAVKTSTVFLNESGATQSGGLTETGGTVFNAGTLTGGVVVSGGTLSTQGTISGGLVNSGTVYIWSAYHNGPILIAPAGPVNGGIVNRSGGSIVVEGPYNAGPATSDSNFDNQAGASLEILAAKYTIAGTLSNAGQTTVDSDSTLTAGGLTNTGLVHVVGTGTLNAAIANSGEVDNYGQINGALVNSGANGLVVNDGTIAGGATNSSTGTGITFVNYGTINGGLVNTAGTFSSAGTVNGGLQNTAIVTARGAINGDIVNSGAGLFSAGSTLAPLGGGLFAPTPPLVGNGNFTNSGTAVLDVSLDNFTGLASLTNTSTAAAGVVVKATLAVAGAVSNGSGATIHVGNGGLLTAGSIANAGTLVIDQGGTVTDALSNSGVVTNNGIYNADITNSGSTASITNGATGVWNGALANGAGATVTTSGQWNGAVSNAGTVNASGQINGAIVNSGTFTVTGALANDGSAFTNTGTLAVGGFGFSGIGAFSNGAGATVSVGTGTANGTLSVASLSNSGTLNLQNGKTGDRIVVAGAYTGTGSAALKLDVNLATGQSDRLVAGTLNGTTTVSLQNLGTGKGWLASPLVLVTGAGNGTIVMASDAQTQAALGANAIVGYRFAKLSDGTDWGLVSTVNSAAGSTAGNHAAAFLNTLDSDLRPGVHDLLSPKGGEGWSGHMWMRAAHAGDRLKSMTTSDDGTSAPVATATRINADTLTAGAELQKSSAGSALQLGAAFSWTQGRARDGVYSSSLDTPSVGLYAVWSAPHLLLGAQAWHDSLSIRPDAQLAEGTMHGHNDTLILSLAAPLTAGIYRFEPYAGYRASSARINPLAVAGTGTLALSSLSGGAVDGGVRLSADSVRNGVHLKPYVSVGMETVSGHGERSVFTPAGSGMAVTLTTTGPGSYAVLSTGIDAQFASGLSAYAHVDDRSGSKASGLSVIAGVRTRF